MSNDLRSPWLPPARILEELPELPSEEVLAALRELRLDPDPDEVHRAYTTRHRMTAQTAAVLGQLQLAARSGRWIEQRELGELARVDAATACRVTQRMRRLGILEVEGGRRYRDEMGQVRRRCLRYRLRWSPVLDLGGHRVLQARISRWARGAGVGLAQVRRCIQRGRKGIEQLERLVRATRSANSTSRPASTRSPSSPAPVERGSSSRGPTPIEELVRRRQAQLHASPRTEWGEVQHGGSSSDEAGSTDSCNEGRVDLKRSSRSTYCRGHVDSIPFKEPEGCEQLRLEVETEASRVDANAPRSCWRMVVNAARATGVAIPSAAQLYLRCCAEARVGKREQRVRNAAGWAAGAFKRQLEAA
ncbi:MAG: hypothetical protein J2P45_08300 [Candidatus Dormibacteraeota bacterium]|nr:hypothetical protein [Candidatus Dormibacteraeota bacterium]